jgi:hypothetical protein
MAKEQEEAQCHKEESKAKRAVDESDDRKGSQRKRQEGLYGHHRPPRSVLQPVVTQSLNHKVVGELYGGCRHIVERRG